MNLPLPARLFFAAIVLTIPVLGLLAVANGDIRASGNLLRDGRALLVLVGMIGVAVYIVIYDPRKRHRITACSACKYPNKGAQQRCERCGQKL